LISRFRLALAVYNSRLVSIENITVIEMYVSVTGLKSKGLIGRLRFWVLTIPAFRAARKASGIILCETRTCNGYNHTLTVWKTKEKMRLYRSSPVHRKAMREFSSIATGKVLGFESDSIPTWDEALKQFASNARDV